VQRTLALAAEGGTVPFIARYRKEATGGLDVTSPRTGAAPALPRRVLVVARSITAEGATRHARVSATTPLVWS
jgi:transcriptional accessory protein Tex/SPT6